MGRQRNNPQTKGKEESPQRMLNEIEVSKLSDIEFKIMVISNLNELSENYKEIQGSYKELTVNYLSMKNNIETTNMSEEETRNTISELRNTLEGI